MDLMKVIRFHALIHYNNSSVNVFWNGLISFHSFNDKRSLQLSIILVSPVKQQMSLYHYF